MLFSSTFQGWGPASIVGPVVTICGLGVVLLSFSIHRWVLILRLHSCIAWQACCTTFSSIYIFTSRVRSAIVRFHTEPISSKLACFSLLFLPFIMCFWFYTFSRFCDRGLPVWRVDKLSSPSISSHHESNWPPFVCILRQFYECGFADRCYWTLVTCA